MRHFLSSIAVLLASPAAAQTDGVASPSTADQAMAAYELSQLSDPLDEKHCAKLALTITDDRKLTSAERDWIVELRRTDVSTIEVSGGGDSVTMPTAGEACRTMLGYLVASEKIDATALWKGSAEDLAVLGTHYHIYPATQGFIGNRIVPDLLAAVKASNTNNAYQPLRNFLNVYDLRSRELTGYKRAASRAMIYAIMTKVAARYSDIPYFVYSGFDGRENEAWID